MSILKTLASKFHNQTVLAGTSPQVFGPTLNACQDFGFPTLRAVARRTLLSRRRLVLRVRRLPRRLRAIHWLMLAGVDVIVADSIQIARAIRSGGVPASRIVLLSDPSDLGLFTTGPRSRSDADAYRLIHVGDLEPETGVADLLACVQTWAARHQDRNVEIWWAGQGCMQGVLQAQPVPANLTQRFIGEVSRQQMASLFLSCDMLVAPVVSEPWSHVLVEAMSAGLPVLGSNRLPAVREFVTHGETGWIFDPFTPGGMARAVDVALNTTPALLEHMRTRATARACSAPGPGLDERIMNALQIGTTDDRFDFAPLRFAR